ncbi:MAG TPA: hypothetical protein VND19_14380 [Acetobacteraceae bacterium]|nr:hypothetical protein [Acetobacteraceae bacterium]
MPRVCHALSLALFLALLLPVGAAAQTIDLDAARTLQQNLQSWFANLLGPNLGTAERNLRVTPEDDHFRVAVPFAGAAGDIEVRADVRPLEGGRWSVDALRLPAASRFTLRMPEPGGPPGSKVPTVFSLRIGTQNSHAMLDPAFATPSSLDINLGNVGLVTDSPRQHQEQHIDRYVVHTTLEPHDGRLDLVQAGTITGWRSASRVGTRPAVAFGADHIQADGRVDGIDRTHAAALLTAVSGLLAALPPAAAAQHGDVVLSAPARAALRALIESLRGIVTDVRGTETIDGLHVAVAGQGEATVRQVRLGIGGAAPNGVLHAAMDVAFDGIAVRNVQPRAAALMPRHLALRPSVAGVSVAALTALALEATDQDVNHARLQADAAALLAHGGVTLGLDTLDLDVGPATLHGHGHVLLTGPNQYQAEAHVTATGLDNLMRQARGNPDLQRVLPFLAMARGFARPQGDHLVWDIVAGNGGLTVNGIALGNPHAEPHQPDKR